MRLLRLWRRTSRQAALPWYLEPDHQSIQAIQSSVAPCLPLLLGSQCKPPFTHAWSGPFLFGLYMCKHFWPSPVVTPNELVLPFFMPLARPKLERKLHYESWSNKGGKRHRLRYSACPTSPQHGLLRLGNQLVGANLQATSLVWQGTVPCASACYKVAGDSSASDRTLSSYSMAPR